MVISFCQYHLAYNIHWSFTISPIYTEGATYRSEETGDIATWIEKYYIVTTPLTYREIAVREELIHSIINVPHVVHSPNMTHQLTMLAVHFVFLHNDRTLL